MENQTGMYAILYFVSEHIIVNVFYKLNKSKYIEKEGELGSR